MKKMRIVFMVFAIVIVVLVIIGIRKQRENVFENEENINISETTGSCFTYNETYEGVRVIDYKIDNPDAAFVDLCKKTINNNDEFEIFRSLYKSDDNYHGFCSNKSYLKTDDESYVRSINLDNALSLLLSTGEIDIINYEFNEKFYIVESNNVDRCVTFLKDLDYQEDLLFDYCRGINTDMGNLYEDNRSYMFGLNDDVVSKLIKNNILTENNKKKANIYFYDTSCGDTINVPKKIDDLEVYSITAVFDNAKVLLLPSTLGRIDVIDGLNVKNLTIPKSVVYIESQAFRDSSIENVIFNGNTYISGEAFNNKVKNVKYNGNCDELRKYKEGFSDYNSISFMDKKGKCNINEK